MARAIATKESVQRAADEILAAGAMPTADSVRDRICGGSYSTISKLLREYIEAAEHANAVTSELPEAVSRVIHDAIVRVANALDIESRERVDAVVRSATEKQQKMRGELDAASREIERLEQALAGSEHEKGSSPRMRSQLPKTSRQRQSAVSRPQVSKLRFFRHSSRRAGMII
ncbi:DNA-binding protein [Congregibacter litoralis]|uniref:Plasmid replication region DNA-binding protein n=1 Tax=Congregibacter litoralis KT71 TaxID=314285 RepID=A4AAE3_9GAMM|nr:Plasmid replication region DNA-binding protein [Congregibacter litoralis KT71]